RLDTFHGYMDESIARNETAGQEKLARQQKTFKAEWPKFREQLASFRKAKWDGKAQEILLKAVDKEAAKYEDDFPALVTKGLDAEAVKAGTRWLQSLVDGWQKGVDQLAPKP
ncbi:MAG: hypothetical protein KJ645_00865, partial [Planctomycetes bacterium]|nr:hypothetical protein [Planctomycetota bacterium]